jgi:hypothetical protein
MPGQAAVDYSLYIDHIRNAFDNTIGNVSPVDKQDKQVLFYDDKVKEYASSYSIPYDLPKPKRRMGDISEVGSQYGHVSYKLEPVSVAVTWGKEEDDFTMAQKKLAEDAVSMGEHFLALDEYMAAELLEGTAGAAGTDYYGIVPYAFNALGLITSSTLFGVSGGNIQTGSGTGGTYSVDSLNTDFKAAVARMTGFRGDRSGNKFWKLNQQTQFIALVPGALSEHFEDYQNSKLFAKVLAGATNDTGAAINVTWQSRFRYRVLDNLTDNYDWYLVIYQPGVNRNRKPFLTLTHQKYDPYEMAVFLNNDSYTMKLRGMNSIFFETYKTVAPGFPASIVKINNA